MAFGEVRTLCGGPSSGGRGYVDGPGSFESILHKKLFQLMGSKLSVLKFIPGHFVRLDTPRRVCSDMKGGWFISGVKAARTRFSAAAS